MFRRRELLDLKTPEGWKFAVTFLHDSQPTGSYNPLYEILYHAEFGSPEALKEAEERLRAGPKTIYL